MLMTGSKVESLKFINLDIWKKKISVCKNNEENICQHLNELRVSDGRPLLLKDFMEVHNCRKTFERHNAQHSCGR